MSAAAVTVSGTDFVRDQLEQFLPKEVTAIAKRTLTKVARILRDDMRSTVVVRTGTLRDAIVSKRERGSRDEVVAAIWITRGTTAKNDAWYWHFVEFGTINQAPRPFIVPAVERARLAMASILGNELFDQIKKQLEKRARAQR